MNDLKTEGGWDQDSVELFGAIMSANASQAAALSDSLLEKKDQRIRELEDTLVSFYRRVDHAASVITTRKLESALIDVEWEVRNIMERRDAV